MGSSRGKKNGADFVAGEGVAVRERTTTALGEKPRSKGLGGARGGKKHNLLGGKEKQ